MEDDSTILLFLFGPFILFGIGLLIGIFWPNKVVSRTTRLISFFSYPFSFFAISLLTLSLIPGTSGPNMLGIAYIFLTPLIYLGSPLIVHAGWLTARSTKKSILSSASYSADSMVYEVERSKAMNWYDSRYPFRVMNVGDQAEFTGYRPDLAITHAANWEKKLRVKLVSIPSYDENCVIIERVN